jgi:N-acetylmuramoyl-L-alanine amidase
LRRSLIALAIVLLSVQPATATDGRKHVCLDPGHGGTDPGAVRGALQEKALNLDIAQRLRVLLEPTYNVKLTRTDNDTTLGNSDRAQICNAFGAHVVLSIHLNASTDDQVDYAWFFYGKRTKDLEFTRVMNANYAIPNAFYTGPLEKKAITNFANGTLLKSNAPAVLVEGLFMSHYRERELLGDGTGKRQQEVAQELAKGIAAWFSR